METLSFTQNQALITEIFEKRDAAHRKSWFGSNYMQVCCEVRTILAKRNSTKRKSTFGSEMDRKKIEIL